MKNIILLLVLTTSLTNLKAQKTVGGVTMPAKLMVGETTLNLNGAGVREKMWIDLYACGLYVQTKTTDATSIVNNDEHTAIKINIISSLISSDKMIAAVDDGFKKSAPNASAELKEKIANFKAVFSKEEIQKGDIYDVVYVPEKGTVIFKNGKIQPIIKGLEFKKALFAIWLGDSPADDDLKDELLGK